MISYIVSVGHLYFQDIVDKKTDSCGGKEQVLLWTTDRKEAYNFTHKSTADWLASATGGTIQRSY